MKNNIQGIRLGTTVNLSINGKLYKKNCNNAKEADELFKLVIKAKENPTEENIKSIRGLLNEKLRVAYKAGLEHDLDSGEVFLAGFNTPIPATLLEVIEEYFDNSYPLDAILNFWKLLMINPDKRVRISLFDFIKTHDFVLTDKGYMVVYKAVNKKASNKVETAEANTFTEYVSNQWLHVKKEWKCSPAKYVVYKKVADDSFGITKEKTAEQWVNDKTVEVLGNLGDLYLALVKTTNEEVKEEEAMYTDMHTNTMNISLGQPVVMDRKDCDSDPAVDCSYGLHVGATAYVENFGRGGKTILACLVNPANVVAVPNYDHSKMRVTEYFPFATATYIDGKIDIIEQKYFETDYCQYEHDTLEAMIEKVKAEDLPIETAKKAEKENRPMSELLKMLEGRLFDL